MRPLLSSVEKRILSTSVLFLLASLLFCERVNAQHASVTVDGERNCAVCHAAHTDTDAAYNLIPGDGSSLGPGGETLSTVSRSCLRCHASERALERSLPTLGLRASELVIGQNQAGDHALGRYGQLDRDVSGIASGSYSWQPLSRMNSDQAISCTVCHDPHRREADISQFAIQRDICSSCHESVVGEILRHRSQPCTACHRLHDGSSRLLTDEQTDRVCGGCHIPGYPPPALAPTSALDSRSSTAPIAPGDDNHRGGFTLDCVSCHGAH
jgi:predicted CXXCH cytochrome family protein